jgi:hypothetical protein
LSLYFFHLRDGEDVLLDPEGRQLDGPGAVAKAALAEARSIISDDVLQGRVDLHYRIDVEDSDRNLVHRLHFADAIEIVGDARRGDERG